MSRVTTQRYSTSFSLGIRFLHADLHKPIYSIYGFVRFADEIVDTFHGFDKAKLLADFKSQTNRTFGTDKFQLTQEYKDATTKQRRNSRNSS